MTETLTQSSATDMDTFRSRLKEIRESRLDLFNSSETLNCDPRKLIEELTLDFQGRVKQIDLEESNIAALVPQDLDAFLEQLRKVIGSTEEENLKISNEIDHLTRALSEDLNLLDSDIESLAFPSNIFNIQDLELQQHIESCNSNISILQDLDFVFRRVEAISQIEDKLSEIKVLEFEGHCIRLSLRMPIHSLYGLFSRHRLDCAVEPHVVEHELLIEVAEKTMDLHKVEIFPNDVPVDGVFRIVKSSSHLAIALSGSKLECLVRQVQYHILLCTLKRLVLKDAKKSRHSFEYSESDETITVHIVGGIDAFIKIPQSWPISDSSLKLLSIKNSSNHSKSI